ncbi:MAG: bifunctional methylenetetrahydrofolate dehydrogenase/methenyltetrahydrofolate cyclohydrolase FolD [Gemmatimonadetes bacterium]|nr:bifunctional methylenetetrahydrofolate dehydrogenase/methenyltetrahydrofolate cyclohydrolase FolD [Gemmatimonadota bacterium]
MSARILDGKRIAAEVRAEVRARAADLSSAGVKPGLAFLLVGEDPASAVYVRSKGQACEEAGFHSVTERRPASTTQAEVLELVERFNADDRIHGILVQLPLPDHIDEGAVLESILPAKDVDGFHPVNAGRLSAGADGFVPCTPLGVREILMREGIETRGRHAVVVGRSNIVGRPMASLFLRYGPGGDATVTVCHSRTRDLGEITRQGDILVVAVGRPEMITRDMVRPGAVVLDVGINRVPDPARPGKTRLVGDVDFEGAAEVAAAITPVPGGIGPMTIAMLLSNTVDAASRVAARAGG